MWALRNRELEDLLLKERCALGVKGLGEMDKRMRLQ